MKSSFFCLTLSTLSIGLLACGTPNIIDNDADVARKESEIVTPTNMAMLVAQNVVGQAEATRLAQVFAAARFGRSAPVITSTDVQLDELTGDPSIYVINFQGGGFVLVAADKRQAPVLAYSDTDHFDAQAVASTQAPEGVRGFMLHARAQTHDIRLGATAPVSNAQVFDRFTDQLSGSATTAGGPTGDFQVDPDNCTGSYAHTYELNFPMQWAQGCGWNAAVPTANGGPCGHAVAGCVAVAVGQVMKYYRVPGGIPWASMSDVAPTFAASQVLSNAGALVGMDYGADASGADLEDVPSLFRFYHYSTSVRYTEDFYEQIVLELQAGRPVIMKGSPDCDFLGFQTCSGHAWVVTGVYDSYNCSTGTGGRHYKMNWGWNGDFNGWYISLDPAGRNYNYHQGVVLGISG